MPPRWVDRSPRQLSVAERETISIELAQGMSFAAIGRRLGRATSTISREVHANGGRDRYRAWRADRRAYERARRPKSRKLEDHPRLARVVEEMLLQRWSPQQIAARLRLEFPHDPEMWVSHETLYQSLFVQPRGWLRKELTVCLRSGRVSRRPRGRAPARGWRIKGMPMISDRPAEADDRAVPGHWESQCCCQAAIAMFAGVGSV
jgi:IS30 family transposase